MKNFVLPSASIGFTLLELSIVLVIIGLLAGGVLVGRDLIAAAQIRKVISEINALKNAINTFQVKYNCLPGDCAIATSFFPTTVNGDGNGYIGGFPTQGNAEMWQAPYQLSLAGLISGSYTGISCVNGQGVPFNLRCASPGVNTPASVIPGAGYTMVAWYNYPADYSSPVLATHSGNSILFGKVDGNYETYIPAITASDAINIDQKVDDGLPAAGLVLVSPPVAPNCITSTTPANSLYNITNTDISCSLFFMDQF